MKCQGMISNMVRVYMYDRQTLCVLISNFYNNLPEVWAKLF